MRRQVQVLTAFGEWRDAVAVTEIEPTHMGGKKVHNFPVIWVEFPDLMGRTPWPAEDVRERNWTLDEAEAELGNGP